MIQHHMLNSLFFLSTPVNDDDSLDGDDVEVDPIVLASRDMERGSLLQELAGDEYAGDSLDEALELTVVPS